MAVATGGEVPFKCFTQLNGVDEPAMMCDRSAVTLPRSHRYFAADTLQNKIVRALAEDEIMPMKEILESFEFFQRVRKEVRSECIADLCCGHGFVGMLFGLFERRVQRVLLVDRREPPIYRKLLKCVARVGPWISDKVQYRTTPINNAREFLEPGCTTVSSHACGVLTDRCIDVAISLHGSIAVMPCCYPKSACQAPPALRLNLGHEMAIDIDRTYRLHGEGYHVHWTSIPASITPMNRVLIGRVG